MQQVALDQREALVHPDLLVVLGHWEQLVLQELQVQLVRLGLQVRVEHQVLPARPVLQGPLVRVVRPVLEEQLARMV